MVQNEIKRKEGQGQKPSLFISVAEVRGVSREKPEEETSVVYSFVLCQIGFLVAPSEVRLSLLGRSLSKPGCPSWAQASWSAEVSEVKWIHFQTFQLCIGNF